MKKTKTSFKLLRVVVVSAFALAVSVFVMTGCSNPTEAMPTPTTGSIIGNVVFLGDTDGIAITIELETIGGQPVDSVDITDTLSADGSFRFDGLNPGIYVLYASLQAPHRRAMLRNVTVTAGGEYPLGSVAVNITGCGCTHGNVGCECTHGNVGCGCTAADHCDCTHGDALPCDCNLTAGDGCDCTLGNFCECTGNDDCACSPNVITGITLSHTAPLSLNVGADHLLFATVLPANAANQMVIWVSSNPAVISVAESMVPRFGISGPESAVRIVANSEGTATITAVAIASGDIEQRATLAVTVQNANAGEPSIPAPAPAVPITVTVTGIPSGYHNSWGELSLRHPGGGYAGWSEVRVEGASVSFAFNAVPGTYSLRLWLGSFEYFIASRNITAGANTIPLSAFTPLEEVSITVTGIPNRYIGDVDGNMRLKHPGTLNQMSSEWSWISSSSATFTMRALPGTYDVHLRFWYDNDWSLLRAYSAPSVNITTGENTIPFTDFQIFEHMTITVTGIPGRYAGGEGAIVLNTPGFIDWIADGWVWPIEGSSATFTVFAMPGTYDVALFFWFETGDDDWDFVLYSVSRRNITAGANTIPFSAFALVPQMSITVTGIPSRYIGSGCLDIYLMIPGTENVVAHDHRCNIVSSSVTVTLWARHIDWVFNAPGTYDVRLEFEVDDGNQRTWVSYLASSRNITVGNTTIPFGDFTPVERGGRANAHTETPGATERAMPDRSRARAYSLRAR